MNKIIMTPPSGSGLPIRTIESANDSLTLTSAAHATYDVTLEVDGVVQDSFSLAVNADTVRNISVAADGL